MKNNDPLFENAMIDRLPAMIFIELLPYLAKGLSNKETAALVFNSPHTIKTHVETIMQKLEIHSRVKLVAFLKDLGY